MRNAGERLMAFAGTPLGEEVLEGVLGGTLAGAPALLEREKHPGEGLLQLAGAIAGGIGVGMAGRRFGASLGRRIHPGEVKNPLALAFGTAFGQDTLAQAAEMGGRRMREGVGEFVMDRYQKGIRRDLAELPQDQFLAKYPAIAKIGKNKQEVAKALDELEVEGNIGKAMAFANMVEPDQLHAAAQELAKNPRFAVQSQELRDALATGNVSKMEDVFQAIARDMGDDSDLADNPVLRVLGLSPESLEGMMKPAEPVTGFHVGRGVGRFLGDEVGVLAGYGLGGLAASGLNLQTSKDREIEELRAQLAQRA
jgi:hypothetical protein